MTAQELLSNYAKAENELFTAIETIRKNKEILIKDFEEKKSRILYKRRTHVS
jgi:vacuolar-type H+-ATPase subunit H